MMGKRTMEDVAIMAAICRTKVEAFKLEDAKTNVDEVVAVSQPYHELPVGERDSD